MERNKNILYELRLAGIRFLLMGIIGYAVEVYSTTFGQIVDQGANWYKVLLTTTGHTHVGAIFIYGCASFVYTFLHEPLIKIKFLRIPVLGPVMRACIYALFFMLVELIFGVVIVYVFRFKMGVGGMWDYSRLWGNILGLTAFSMFPAWWFAGLLGEFVHIRMIAIDDILVNFKDNEYYKMNTKVSRAAFFDKKIQSRKVRKS